MIEHFIKSSSIDMRATCVNNKSMNRDAKQLGQLISMAIDSSPYTKSELARHCGVSDQAVTGWVQTGRIAKRHLPQVARFLNMPIEALLNPYIVFNHENEAAVPGYSVKGAARHLAEQHLEETKGDYLPGTAPAAAKNQWVEDMIKAELEKLQKNISAASQLTIDQLQEIIERKKRESSG